MNTALSILTRDKSRVSLGPEENEGKVGMTTKVPPGQFGLEFYETDKRSTIPARLVSGSERVENLISNARGGLYHDDDDDDDDCLNDCSNDSSSDDDQIGPKGEGNTGRRVYDVFKTDMVLSRMKQLHRQTYALESKCQDIQARYDGLMLEKEAVEGELCRYTSMYRTLMHEMANMKLEVDVLKNKCESTKDRQDTEHGETKPEEMPGPAVHLQATLAEKIKALTVELHASREEVIRLKSESQAEERRDEGYNRKYEEQEAVLLDMERKLCDYKSENSILKTDIDALEERLISSQGRIIQLEEELQYFSGLTSTSQRNEEEEDMYNERLHELTQELLDREHDLASLQETLNEERERCSGLHEQTLRQVMEIEDLRVEAARALEYKRELEALRHVHAETLERLAQAQLNIRSSTPVTSTAQSTRTPIDEQCVVVDHDYQQETWLI
jgi:predicted RNase H-like nuclease (RuvC/YqgF family)